MRTVVGIFTSRAEAERALERLRSIGIADKNLDLLTPGALKEEVQAVPTTETEQPGMGPTMGGVVGGALGAASGMSLGAAAASLLLPGVGPIIASGIIGAALLGIGGAVGGAAAGESLEKGMADGLPRDEMFIYEDALRKGRSLVFALAENDEQADAARDILLQAGAEDLDTARDNWWIGLRDAEEEHYKAGGGNFQSDEPKYRSGFEAALRPEMRGKSYEEAQGRLRERYADLCDEECFQRGYYRGQSYQEALTRKQKA